MRQPRSFSNAPREVRPPRIPLRRGIDRAERIDPAHAVDHRIEPRALVRQEARHARVTNRIERIDRAVRDIIIAADDMTATVVTHGREPSDETLEKFVLHPLAQRAARTRRHVERRDTEFAPVEAEVASLDIHVGHPEPAHDRVGGAFCVDRDAAIAFLLRIDEGVRILLERERFGRNLMELRLGLLDAEHVRRRCAQPREEALAGGGSDPVCVEGGHA